jgi:hypothetical protein
MDSRLVRGSSQAPTQQSHKLTGVLTKYKIYPYLPRLEGINEANHRPFSIVATTLLLFDGGTI